MDFFSVANPRFTGAVVCFAGSKATVDWARGSEWQPCKSKEIPINMSDNVRNIRALFRIGIDTENNVFVVSDRRQKLNDRSVQEEAP